VELTGDVNRFSLAVDFTARFAAFDPPRARAARPARDLVVPGTVACWRFEQAAADGGKVRDVSGNGNDLTRVTIGGDVRIVGRPLGEIAVHDPLKIASKSFLRVSSGGLLHRWR
jgi:hypothetical protein